MNNLVLNQTTDDARTAILKSIREHLAESASRDAVTGVVTRPRGPQPRGPQRGSPAGVEEGSPAVVGRSGRAQSDRAGSSGEKALPSAVEMFREHLEAVGGHCVVVQGEIEAARALNRIIAELQATSLPARRIALSDAPLIGRLSRALNANIEKARISPSTVDLFGYDIGLTTAQAAIAETGTLVLESDCERHRLISLLPPVHITIVNAGDIRLTLGEALKQVRRNGLSDMSRAITFITGPSRTADIELTLTIGVHGPKELYVIVDEEKALTADANRRSQIEN